MPGTISLFQYEADAVRRAANEESLSVSTFVRRAIKDAAKQEDPPPPLYRERNRLLAKDEQLPTYMFRYRWKDGTEQLLQQEAKRHKISLADFFRRAVLAKVKMDDAEELSSSVPPSQPPVLPNMATFSNDQLFELHRRLAFEMELRFARPEQRTANDKSEPQPESRAGSSLANGLHLTK